MSRHLMARFRHLHAAEAPSEFPWGRDDRDWVYGKHGIYDRKTEAYHAPLENGHRLRVWDDSITNSRHGNPPELPGSHWKGGFDHGADFPNDPKMPGYPHNMHPAFSAAYEEDSPLRAKAYPTREQAMRAVEKLYQQTFPIGTNTGPHDSGTDYSDLNKFMGEL